MVDSLPAARLLIIGEGPHRQRTEELFREAGLQQSVVFTGGINEVEKNQLLARSKVGLSLSYEEGWGLSITEFLASGLAVVAYELPVFAEVFPGQLAIVPLHDQLAAAAKIISLLQNEPHRQALGQAGKAFVVRYDYRAVAQSELSLLQALWPATAKSS